MSIIILYLNIMKETWLKIPRLVFYLKKKEKRRDLWVFIQAQKASSVQVSKPKCTKLFTNQYRKLWQGDARPNNYTVEDTCVKVSVLESSTICCPQMSFRHLEMSKTEGYNCYCAAVSLVQLHGGSCIVMAMLEREAVCCSWCCFSYKNCPEFNLKRPFVQSEHAQSCRAS